MIRPALALAFALAAPLAGWSVERDGVAFPDRATVAGAELPVRGTATLTWRWIVDVYTIALWAGPGDPLATAPKRIEFRYHRGFTARELADATTATVRERVDAAAWTALADDLRAWNALYREVRDGSRCAIVDDGAAVALELDGTILGAVRSPALARALFSIWLGPRPLDRGVRERLLGGR